MILSYSYFHCKLIKTICKVNFKHNFLHAKIQKAQECVLELCPSHSVAKMPLYKHCFQKSTFTLTQRVYKCKYELHLFLFQIISKTKKHKGLKQGHSEIT
jgi:hypothetical protein